MAFLQYRCSLFKYVGYLAIISHLCPAYKSEITIITEGQHFMLAYPENFPSQCNFVMTYTPSLPWDSHDTFCAVTISVPALDITVVENAVLGTPTSISLREGGYSPDADADTSHNNIIYVDVAVGKLSVFGSIDCLTTSKQQKFGEFLAVPVEFWGMRYVVIAPYQLSCGYTTTVITTNVQTSLNITLKIRSLKPSGHVEIGGKHIKDSGVWSLLPHSRMEIVAEYTDITGTILESDYPIAVIVGPKNEELLSNAFCTNGQSLFVEQLIPIYAWGKTYYLNDGGASLSILYKYEIRIVTSLANTTIYLTYATSFENGTRLFKTSKYLKLPGSDHYFSLENSFGFDIVSADWPILVAVYTARGSRGGDGAMMQAVQRKAWPERVVLTLNSNLGQRIHILTDSACSSSLTFLLLVFFAIYQTGIEVSIILVYRAMDYGKQESNFYIPSVGVVWTESQMVISVDTNVQGCKGISAFLMNDFLGEDDVLGACPAFWGVECTDGKIFDIELKLCVSFEETSTTSLPESSSTSQASSAVTSTDTAMDDFQRTRSIRYSTDVASEYSTDPQKPVTSTDMDTFDSTSSITYSTDVASDYYSSEYSTDPQKTGTSTNMNTFDRTSPITYSTDVASEYSTDPQKTGTSTNMNTFDSTSPITYSTDVASEYSTDPQKTGTSTNMNTFDRTSPITYSTDVASEYSTDPQKTGTSTNMDTFDSTSPITYSTDVASDYTTSLYTSHSSDELMTTTAGPVIVHETIDTTEWQETADDLSLPTNPRLSSDVTAGTIGVVSRTRTLPPEVTHPSINNATEAGKDAAVDTTSTTTEDAVTSETKHPIIYVHSNGTHNFTTQGTHTSPAISSTQSSVFLDTSTASFQKTQTANTDKIKDKSTITPAAEKDSKPKPTPLLITLTEGLVNRQNNTRLIADATLMDPKSETSTTIFEPISLSYESTITTSPSTNDAVSTKKCPCFCWSRNNMTRMDTISTVDDLKVSVANLSRTRRLHTSTRDWRTQQVTIGILGAVVIFVMMLLLAVPCTARFKQHNNKAEMKCF